MSDLSYFTRRDSRADLISGGERSELGFEDFERGDEEEERPADQAVVEGVVVVPGRNVLEAGREMGGVWLFGGRRAIGREEEEVGEGVGEGTDLIRSVSRPLATL